RGLPLDRFAAKVEETSWEAPPPGLPLDRFAAKGEETGGLVSLPCAEGAGEGRGGVLFAPASVPALPVQAPQHLEQLPERRRALVLLPLRARLPRQLPYLVPVGVRKFSHQLAQRAVGILDQPLAPVLDAVQERSIAPRLLAVRLQRLADRVQRLIVL